MKRGNLRFVIVLIVIVGLFLVFSLPTIFDKKISFSPGRFLRSVSLEGADSDSSIVVPTCIPTTEVCDSIDNDCDNLIDEENVCRSGGMQFNQQSGQEAYNTFMLSTSPPGTTDYYGTVTIDGLSAPAGTEVLAVTEGMNICGSFTVTSEDPGIGLYGFLHCNCGGEDPPCTGDRIIFAIKRVGFSIYEPLVSSGDTVWDQGRKQVNLNRVTQCDNGVSFGSCVLGSAPSYCNEIRANEGGIINKCGTCGCTGRKDVCCTNGACGNVRDVKRNDDGTYTCPEKIGVIKGGGAF